MFKPHYSLKPILYNKCIKINLYFTLQLEWHCIKKPSTTITIKYSTTMCPKPQKCTVLNNKQADYDYCCVKL